MVNALSSFGDINKAAKWLQRNNSDGTLNDVTQKMLLFKAYKNSGATKDIATQALLNAGSSVTLKGLFSSGISGLTGSLSAIGAGIGSIASMILPALLPVVVTGLVAAAGKFSWDHFLTNNAANKKYEESASKYDTAVSERGSLQSEYNTNKERYYELNAKENRSADEQTELENLGAQNELMKSQLEVKNNLVDTTERQQALDAKAALEKKGVHNNRGRAHWYNGLSMTYQDDIDQASDMITSLNRKKAEKAELQKNQSEYSQATYDKKLKSLNDDINDLEGDLTDSITDISDKAQDLWGDDGTLVDDSTKGVADRVLKLTDDYKKAIGSTSTTSDKMNNIFALSKFSDLKDKLIDAGKSGGTDAVEKLIEDTKGLDKAMDNAGLTADDLAEGILSFFPEHFTHHFYTKTETVSKILLQLFRQKIQVIIHKLIQGCCLIVCKLFFQCMISL